MTMDNAASRPAPLPNGEIEPRLDLAKIIREEGGAYVYGKFTERFAGTPDSGYRAAKFIGPIHTTAPRKIEDVIPLANNILGSPHANMEFSRYMSGRGEAPPFYLAVSIPTSQELQKMGMSPDQKFSVIQLGMGAITGEVDNRAPMTSFKCVMMLPDTYTDQIVTESIENPALFIKTMRQLYPESTQLNLARPSQLKIIVTPPTPSRLYTDPTSEVQQQLQQTAYSLFRSPDNITLRGGSQLSPEEADALRQKVRSQLTRAREIEPVATLPVTETPLNPPASGVVQEASGKQSAGVISRRTLLGGAVLVGAGFLADQIGLNPFRGKPVEPIRSADPSKPTGTRPAEAPPITSVVAPAKPAEAPKPAETKPSGAPTTIRENASEIYLQHSSFQPKDVLTEEVSVDPRGIRFRLGPTTKEENVVDKKMIQEINGLPMDAEGEKFILINPPIVKGEQVDPEQDPNWMMIMARINGTYKPLYVYLGETTRDYVKVIDRNGMEKPGNPRVQRLETTSEGTRKDESGQVISLGGIKIL